MLPSGCHRRIGKKHSCGSCAKRGDGVRTVYRVRRILAGVIVCLLLSGYVFTAQPDEPQSCFGNTSLGAKTFADNAPELISGAGGKLLADMTFQRTCPLWKYAHARQRTASVCFLLLCPFAGTQSGLPGAEYLIFSELIAVRSQTSILQYIHAKDGQKD